MTPHQTIAFTGKLLTRNLLRLTLLLCAHYALAANTEDPRRIWIERPWEYRYVLLIESPDRYKRWKTFESKNIDTGEEINFFRVEPLFPLNVVIWTDPDAAFKDNQGIGVVVVQFDTGGAAITPNELALELQGRMSQGGLRIVLSAGDKPDSWQFKLGNWYTGRTGDDLAFTPAICSASDMEWRYKKSYAIDRFSFEGNFGCREWAYYLQHDDIPYIDVTSYGKDKSTYIRPVLGWGRFDTPSKPVIGKHGAAWVCLHECPNGEAPGIIPNIAIWAAKNGWPAPKPPKKQPMFPDRPLKRGEFVD